MFERPNKLSQSPMTEHRHKHTERSVQYTAATVLRVLQKFFNQFGIDVAFSHPRVLRLVTTLPLHQIPEDVAASTPERNARISPHSRNMIAVNDLQSTVCMWKGQRQALKPVRTLVELLSPSIVWSMVNKGQAGCCKPRMIVFAATLQQRGNTYETFHANQAHRHTTSPEH